MGEVPVMFTVRLLPPMVALLETVTLPWAVMVLALPGLFSVPAPLMVRVLATVKLSARVIFLLEQQLLAGLRVRL